MAKLERLLVRVDGIDYELPIPESIDSNDGTVDIKLAAGASGAVTQLLMDVINDETEFIPVEEDIKKLEAADGDAKQ